MGRSSNPKALFDYIFLSFILLAFISCFNEDELLLLNEY
jgi:hypothetical protein